MKPAYLSKSMPRSHGGRDESGFSIMELLVVVTVIVILLAFAIPQLMGAIYAGRVRGAANDFASLIQQARITAEKQNTSLPIYTGTVESNAAGAYIGVNSGSSWSSGDPDVPYATGVVNGSASNVPTALNPGFTASTSTTLYFNWRGIPVNSSGTYLSPNGVMYYLQDSHNYWAAVSVSGAGRTKVWVLTGTTWH